MQSIREGDPILLWLFAKVLANTDKDATDAADALGQRNRVPGGRAPFVNGQRLGQVGKQS